MSSAAWPDYQIEMLKRLWSQGKTGTQISEAFDGARSRSAVVGMARRLGLESRPRPAGIEKRIRLGKPSPKPVGMRAFDLLDDLVADDGYGLRGAAAAAGVSVDRAQAHFAALRARYDFGLPATAVDDLVRPLHR